MGNQRGGHLANITAEERLEFKRVAAKKFEARVERFHEENPKYSGYLKGIPKTMQKTWLDSWDGVAPLRQVVKAKCQDCVAHQREEIRNCPVKTCPLWQYRPYRDEV